MLFFISESVRSNSRSLGEHDCPVCASRQAFSEQTETLWFCVFGIPLLKLATHACYWRCENCLNAFVAEELDEPSQVALVRQVIAYLLLGYSQEQHAVVGREICLKLSGFDFEADEYQTLVREVAAGRIDLFEQARHRARQLNAIGKQQVLEAAFLTTYVCCDMQYEDRLRVNLIGNALDVGLEFVEYAISQTRKQNYYGVRRFLLTESEG